MPRGFDSIHVCNTQVNHTPDSAHLLELWGLAGCKVRERGVEIPQD